METKDPALTKTPISSHETLGETDADNTAKNRPDTPTSSHNNVHDHDEIKGTQALQETVIGSDFIDDIENLDDEPVDASQANKSTKEHIAGESVTQQDSLRTAVVDAQLAERDVMAQDNTYTHNHNELEQQTSVNKGTDTFKEDVVDSIHVNDGDNPARQPDRRDQQGSTAFDEGVNEDTVGSEAPMSEGINNMNRYASIDNAQSRILNPDEKD